MTDPARCSALKQNIVCILGAVFGNKVDWSRGQFPTVRNLTSLSGSPAFHLVPNLSHLLDNASDPTVHEKANGAWQQAAKQLGAQKLNSLSELTAAFNQHLWPMRCEQSTRKGNWRYWAMTVTWAISWQACIPMFSKHSPTILLPLAVLSL